MGTVSQTVERHNAQPAVVTPEQSLQQLIERQQTAIARALPKGMTAERFARILVTTVKQTPDLLKCDQLSFLGAAMTAAQLGLEPGPLGEAYLVPFGRTCTFVPGAPGLVKLAIQSGHVRSVIARTVYEGDEFDYEYGLDEHLKHKPTQFDPGPAIFHYAIARYMHGGSEFVVMSQAAINRHKAKFAKSDKAWRENPEPMARKTVVKQLMKLLPKSAEMHRAMEADEQSFNLSSAGAVSLVDVGPVEYGDAIDVPAAEITQGEPTETSGP